MKHGGAGRHCKERSYGFGHSGLLESNGDSSTADLSRLRALQPQQKQARQRTATNSWYEEFKRAALWSTQQREWRGHVDGGQFMDLKREYEVCNNNVILRPDKLQIDGLAGVCIAKALKMRRTPAIS